MSRGVYTIEELVDGIDKELSWRKKELKVFKDSISSENSPKQKTLLRCAIPILYAHWEGFVKTSCELYLEYVSNKNEILKKLKPQFVAIALRNNIQAQEINKISERTKAVEYIINNLELTVKIPIKNIIKTKSNLKYNIFKDICYILCIPIENFEKQEAMIDELVDLRNNIAHGNYLKVDYKLFCDFYRDTIFLLDSLRTEIENASVLNHHMK